MEVIKMENIKKIESTIEKYKKSQVKGRTKFCPRKGVYKIMSIYKGICLGSPALMAKVLWKKNLKGDYSEIIFDMQLETFYCYPNTILKTFDYKIMKGREIRIIDTLFIPGLTLFYFEWELLPLKDGNQLTIEDPLITDFENKEDLDFPDIKSLYNY